LRRAPRPGRPASWARRLRAVRFDAPRRPFSACFLSAVVSFCAFCCVPAPPFRLFLSAVVSFCLFCCVPAPPFRLFLKRGGFVLCVCCAPAPRFGVAARGRPFFESCGSRPMSGFSGSRRPAAFSSPVALALCPGFPRRAGRPFFGSCGSRLVSGFPASRRPAVFRALWLSPYVRIFWVAPAGRLSSPVALAFCPAFPVRAGRPLF
jgi:hypothetical protein